MNELKPCPFCGGEAKIYGREIRDYVNGQYGPKSRREFWVQTFCVPTCIYGNTHTRAFGIIGGIRYNSPEAAAEAWNRREWHE